MNRIYDERGKETNDCKDKEERPRRKKRNREETDRKRNIDYDYALYINTRKISKKNE